jgi:hypothetical protein
LILQSSHRRSVCPSDRHKGSEYSKTSKEYDPKKSLYALPQRWGDYQYPKHPMSSGLDVDEERQRHEAMKELKKKQGLLPEAKVVELELVSRMLQARDHAVQQELSLFSSLSSYEMHVCILLLI